MTLDELHQMFDAMVDLLLDEHAKGKHERCGKFCKAATT